MIHFLVQVWRPWHLGQHIIFAWKHLQRFVWHFWGPLQLHFVNLCSPHVDCAVTADRKDTDLSRRISSQFWSSVSSFGGHKSNWFPDHPPFNTPARTAVLLISVSRSLWTITPGMFCGSSLLRSTNENRHNNIGPRFSRLKVHPISFHQSLGLCHTICIRKGSTPLNRRHEKFVQW